MYSYAITVKYVYGGFNTVTKTDYAQWLAHAHDIHRNLDFVQIEFEEDKSGRLHMHALMQTPLKRLYRGKLNKNGFNVDIQPIKPGDEPRWQCYIQKDQFKTYMFIDDEVV